MILQRHSEKFLIALLVFLFAAVRFWGLTDSCLWFDEIFSVHAAEHTWTTLLPFVARDLIHPPLFYLLLKIWIGIGGEGLFWLRLLPVAIASISIIPFLCLCRQLKPKFTAVLLSLLFFAVNGSLIKYSQEVRMYSLLLCISLFSVWLFVRFLKLGKGKFALLVVNVLLVYTHYFGWFVVVSEVIAILIFQRIKIRQMLLLLAANVAAFLPWIFALRDASTETASIERNIGWIQRPGVAEITQFLLNLFEPFYYARSSLDPVSDFRVAVPILLIAVIAGVLFMRNIKQRDANEIRTANLLLLFLLVPLVSVFAMSWLVPFSIWGTRHLIVVFPSFLLLFAICLDSIENKTLKTAIVTFVMLFCGYAFATRLQRHVPKYSWCGLEKLEAQLPAAEAATRESSKIYAFEDLVAYHLWFGLHRTARNYRVVKISGIEGLIEDKAYFLPRDFDEIEKVNMTEISDKKFWIAFRSPDWDISKPPLNEFIMSGYRAGEPLIFQADDEKAFLVEIENQE